MFLCGIGNKVSTSPMAMIFQNVCQLVLYNVFLVKDLISCRYFGKKSSLKKSIGFAKKCKLSIQQVSGKTCAGSLIQVICKSKMVSPTQYQA